MDTSLYYREKGRGIPLILLHGNGENGDYFRHQIEHFSKSYRVIALDTRGHGKSPRGTAAFTMEQFAEDLNGLMVKLGIPKAIILGFSDGANIAMKFALKYPGKVYALVLNGGNLNTRGVKRKIQIPIEIGYKITKVFANKSEEAKKHKELHAVKNPTLVIAGTKDMIKTAHTEEIAKNISGAELVIIKGDHFIANKEPEEFNKRVEAFLAKTAIR